MFKKGFQAAKVSKKSRTRMQRLTNHCLAKHKMDIKDLIDQPDNDQDQIEIDIDSQKVIITKNATATANALYKCDTSNREVDNKQ